MRLADILGLSTQSIKGNKLRSFLTIAIITLGVWALISIITVIQILENNIMTSFSAMGTTSFSVQAEGLRGSRRHSAKKKQSNRNPTITYQQAIQFAKSYDYPGITGISILASGGTVIKSKKKTSNPNTKVLAVDENFLPISEIAIAAGRNFNRVDATRNENICFVGNKISKNYFGSPRKAIDKKLYVGNTPYRIIGVLEETGSSFIDRTDNQVFISLSNARQHFALQNNSYVISVKVRDVKYLPLAQDAAIGRMRTIKQLKLNETENFNIVSSDGLANMLLGNIRFVSMAASAIGFITLLGAAIGLMNIMLVAVAERTREIGVSKAIGATNKTIRLQFLSESITISLIGGVLGVIIGIATGNFMSLMLESPFVIPWKWALLGLLTCLVVGLVSGIYPALKASRLNPISALRYE